MLKKGTPIFNRPHRGTGDLSPREKQVAILRAQGYGQKQIAYQLGIATTSVRNLFVKIKGKLDFADAATITQFVIWKHWIEPKDFERNLHANRTNPTGNCSRA